MADELDFSQLSLSEPGSTCATSTILSRTTREGISQWHGPASAATWTAWFQRCARLLEAVDGESPHDLQLLQESLVSREDVDEIALDILPTGLEYRLYYRGHESNDTFKITGLDATGLEEPEDDNICSLVIGDRHWQVVYDRKIIILSNAASSEGYSMILRRN